MRIYIYAHVQEFLFSFLWIRSPREGVKCRLNQGLKLSTEQARGAISCHGLEGHRRRKTIILFTRGKNQITYVKKGTSSRSPAHKEGSCARSNLPLWRTACLWVRHKWTDFFFSFYCLRHEHAVRSGMREREREGQQHVTVKRTAEKKVTTWPAIIKRPAATAVFCFSNFDACVTFQTKDAYELHTFRRFFYTNKPSILRVY